MMKTISALLFGDVVGQPGCRALFFNLNSLRKEYNADIVIANGENASEGFGIIPEMAQRFFTSGVDVITTGNHIWQKKEILPYLDSEAKILRPVNYPSGVPGHGYCTIDVKGNSIGIINLQGRKRMGLYLDCPFRSVKKVINKIKSTVSSILVDFHAECPMEKEAMGFYLDGEVSCMVGTHTHIQTCDEKILPKGTGYITDIGMTGPKNSVIGALPEISIKRGLTQIPIKMEISNNDAVIEGVLVTISVENGKAVDICRIRI